MAKKITQFNLCHFSTPLTTPEGGARRVMDSEYMTLAEIVEQLELCGFECEAGRLDDNVAFQGLKRMAQEETEVIADIERIVEEALTDAQTELKPTSAEPINWSDLHCGIAAPTYCAEISEAAPNCMELIAFVRARLAKEGYDYVDVQTEW